MIISKSDYIKYLHCPKAVWLHKKRKDLRPDTGDSRGARIGESVEEAAYTLFPDGVKVESSGFNESLEESTRLVLDKTPVIFQASFWNNDLFCRSDIIKYNSADNTWDLYEVKAATKLKDEYIPDLAFQKIALAEAGMKVLKSLVIYVNKEYVRQDELDSNELLITEDVSQAVDDLIDEARGDIDEIYGLLKQREEPEVRILKQCYNPYECPFIEYCWQDIPKHSIYRVYPSEADLNSLLDQGITALKDMPKEMISKDKYKQYYFALKHSRPLIDIEAIRAELDRYRYPLYFLDYETSAPAVPAHKGTRPYQQVPFQYSLHVLEAPDVELKHYEYLAEKDEDPIPGLAKSLSSRIGPKGSVIVWYKGFECGRNKEMAEHCPEYADFFNDINERTLDLMDPFANGWYAHKDFLGSASIKSVLPVLVPNLSYKDLNIQEGGTASDSWPVLVRGGLEPDEKQSLKQDMLEYCKLDTLAMVEIYKVLLKTIK